MNLPSGRRQLVIAIDDEPLIHHLLRRHLETLEVEVRCFTSPDTAMEAIRHDRPDPVLLDVGLDETDGFSVCRRIKTDPASHQVPVIFLTGESMTVDKVRGFDLGAWDYVTKPFEPAELGARTRTALRHKAVIDLLTQQAFLDALAALHNREFFERQADNDLQDARHRRGAMSVVVLDLDGFEQVNRRCGRPVGDKVLQYVAGHVRRHAQSLNATACCRLRGDAFGLLLPFATAQEARRAAEGLRAVVADCRHLKLAIGGTLTASAGVTTTDWRELITTGELLQRAEDAAARAKAAGGNTVVALGPAEARAA